MTDFIDSEIGKTKSKMNDRDRIEREFKKNLKRIKVGNKSPDRKGK